METPFGLLILIFTASFFALIGAKMGQSVSVILLGGFSGLLVGLVIFINPKIGFFITMILPFALNELGRQTDNQFPISSVIQALFVFLLIVILLKRRVSNFKPKFKKVDSFITWLLIFLQLYMIIQAFNPNMVALNGWFLSFRTSMSTLLAYALCLLLIGNDKRFVKQYLNFWFALTLIAALYGCHQEWFGYSQKILNQINSDPVSFGLLFVGGRYRKFSFLADPASFGILMATSAVVFLVLGLRAKERKYTIIYLSGVCFMILSMAYSGTRTAYAALIAGVFIYVAMTITNKRSLVLTGIGALGLIVIVYGPIYGNANINRIRSLFDTEDESLNVRDINRKSIQPYIYANPLGGGVLTTELLGEKYNPEHELAGFMPDGGYLKVVLETGWIGLLIFVLIYYSGLIKGIAKYYSANDYEIKSIYLALVPFLFALAIANYAQKSTFGFPIISYIFPTLAIISKLHLFDGKIKSKNTI